ncbi:MAG TPA: LssY C-terminal domain-containing protein [Nocardioidaceae bacterium]|nr:LssY C-terminal domain-containing protein [Nocardioidaceae bacterium]
MTAVPAKIIDVPGQVVDRTHLFDRIFFGLGALATIWLAWAIARASFKVSWWGLLLVVLFWLVLAYLALPRLNRILSSIYVPDYFIGRTRTSDGLLGDPLNLAFRGTGEQLSSALQRAGWVKADPVTLASSFRIVTSTLTGRSYVKAPVSPLLLFGRRQDAAFQQEVSGNPAQRHHVRLWRTPAGWLLPGGHRVDWLAGGTYDRRVGLSLFTLQITHKIDADIDVERDFIMASVGEAEPRATVEPLVDFTTGYHSRNGGGDTVHTDGTLPIVDLSEVVPVPQADPLTNPSDNTAKVPLEVLLPAILTIVLGPLSLLTALSDLGGFSSTPERLLLGVAVALTVTSVLCAIGMLRRSAWARRWLLLLSSLIVVAQLSEFELATQPRTQLTATLHSGVMILVLFALSSSAATAWCQRTPQRGR